MLQWKYYTIILLSHYPYLAGLFSFPPTYACCLCSVAMRCLATLGCHWHSNSPQYAYIDIAVEQFVLVRLIVALEWICQ